MTTRDEAWEAAADAIAEGILLRDSLSVEEAARRAYTPTGPSLAELEDRIRAQRATQTPAPAVPRTQRRGLGHHRHLTPAARRDLEALRRGERVELRYGPYRQLIDAGLIVGPQQSCRLVEAS